MCSIYARIPVSGLLIHPVFGSERGEISWQFRLLRNEKFL
jgi:hypothetical protein